MAKHPQLQAREDWEYITSRDLLIAAHELLGNIDLDPASSDLANTYVNATEYYTPTKDGLNDQQWFGNVYLFPPNGVYFWEKANQRWKKTRSGASPTLVSSYAVWFRTLYKKWMAQEIKQGLYFANCPDMIRYEPKIFDFPMCVLHTAPTLWLRTEGKVKLNKTCTSMLVYLPPVDDVENCTERFEKIYTDRGRIIR